MLKPRLHPISLVDATGEPRIYPYHNERLWFVMCDGFLFAVMAFCADDALSAVQDAIAYRNLTGIPADYGVETPRTHGEYMGLSRKSFPGFGPETTAAEYLSHSDYEKTRRDELKAWARRNNVVIPFRFLYPSPVATPEPKSPQLLALKSAERFVRQVLTETAALGHDDLFRGDLDNATETLRIIQDAIVKGETE